MLFFFFLFLKGYALKGKSFVKNVPCRAVPTKTLRKKALNDEQSKKARIVKDHTSEIEACLSKILIDPSSKFISFVINKIDLKDEKHIIVDHTSIDKAVLPIKSKLESIDFQLTQLFTIDAQEQLKIILNYLRTCDQICLKCSKSVPISSEIVCQKCKSAYHPKCVNVYYVPKKKSWFCSDKCRECFFFF